MLLDHSLGLKRKRARTQHRASLLVPSSNGAVCHAAALSLRPHAATSAAHPRRPAVECAPTSTHAQRPPEEPPVDQAACAAGDHRGDAMEVIGDGTFYLES